MSRATITNGRATPEERLTAVEQQMGALSARVDSLVLAVDRVADGVHRFSEGNRTNWQTLAAWATVILAIGAAAMGLMNSMLSDRIAIVQKSTDNSEQLSHTRHDGQSELIRVLNDRVGMLRADYDASNSKHVANFKEVETQLRSLSNRTNLGLEGNERFIADLWQQVHDRPLPRSHVYPVIGDRPGGDP